MATPPEDFCLSAMALRIEGCAGAALDATRNIIRSVRGDIIVDERYGITGAVHHPDGRAVTVVNPGFRLIARCKF